MSFFSPYTHPGIHSGIEDSLNKDKYKKNVKTNRLFPEYQEKNIITARGIKILQLVIIS